MLKKHLTISKLSLFKNKIIEKTFIKEVGIVTIGNILARGFAFLSAVFLARILGPQEFAKFSIFFAISILCPQFFSGFDYAFVRFLAKEKKPSTVKAMLFIKIVSIMILFLVGLAAIEPISSYMKIESYKSFIVISFIAGAGISFLALLLSTYQAEENFISYSTILFFPRGIFLLLIITFWYLFNLIEFRTYFLLYTISFLLFALLSIFSLSRFLSVKTEKKEIKKEAMNILHFGKWLNLSTFLGSFYLGADLLILSHFTGKVEVGIYSSAVRIARLIGIVSGAISIISNPKASKLKSFEEIKIYLKRSYQTLLLLLIPLSIIILLRNPIIKIFFGIEYQAAGAPFAILSIAYILIMFYTPLVYLFYTINRPHLLLLISATNATFFIFFCYLFIPRLLSLGAALAVLVSYSMGAAMTLILIFFHFRKKEILLSQGTLNGS